MRRKLICASFALTLMPLLCAAASAQVGALYGRVRLKGDDGVAVPVAGAAVDVFRNDVRGKYTTRTDERGRFVFERLPVAGVYTLSASSPRAQPAAVANVKAGSEIEYEITLEPGGGGRFTEDEARAAAVGLRVAEEQPVLCEYCPAFKAGNEALNAKNFDEAIRHYDVGLAAAPADLPHITAVFLTNRSVALRSRGVESYNQSQVSNDAAAKRAKLESAARDFSQAAEGATKAVEIIKAQAIPADAKQLRALETSRYFALAARAEAMRMAATVDPARAEAAFSAFREYIEEETDPHRKSKARVDAARMLLDANLAGRAAEEFQKILAAEPNNADAALGLGLAHYRSGDRGKFSEAAYYLRKFIAEAPNTHPMRETARETLERLKSFE